MSEQQEQAPVEIPLSALSDDALNGIIDNFINREGTDYGWVEVSYEKKIERVRHQLTKGEVKIVFDPNSETVTLLTSREWQRVLSQGGSKWDRE